MGDEAKEGYPLQPIGGGEPIVSDYGLCIMIHVKHPLHPPTPPCSTPLLHIYLPVDTPPHSYLSDIRTVIRGFLGLGDIETYDRRASLTGDRSGVEWVEWVEWM